MKRSRKEKELITKTGWPVVNLTTSAHKTYEYRLRRAGRGFVWEKIGLR
ncbi:MAG TPA: hypothetical protein PKB12_04475 [Elusimicrobiota bacterium]|jgi:hypothetical protein|nr:hypothetical protein [Elusimicrobiota bacterium]HMX42955.1 hypothetical protein [Elusimicrobiota bacterium]HNC74805.1 hypothetical protein [Elusimicrobiota bacterium]HNF58926.1 hypothetical protein [Elusimicrobiota bacterium]